MIQAITNRRQFLRAGCSALVTLALSGAAKPGDARGQTTAGTGASGPGEKPRTQAPPNMTDCHYHVIDPRYPATRQVKPALLSDYRKLQARLGIKRSVVVQPSFYRTDNRCVLEVIAESGGSARGIVDVHENVTDAELRDLDAKGARGIRFNVRQGDAQAMNRIENMSRRVDELGWHVQMNINPDQTAAAKDLFNRLRSPIVFDHMGHLTSTGLDHPARAVIEGLLQKGRTWVKLSGFYLGSKVGLPTLADAGAVARFFLKAAPERLVWGSDWPHVTATVEQDDAQLFDLFGEWVPDEALRTRILVDNPARLYRF